MTRSPTRCTIRLVILQPFYLPYSGTFELVRLADSFVFYDDVQLERQSWQTRNRIATPNGAQWLSVPVIGPHDQRIIDTPINPTARWQRKHLNSLRQSYASAPGAELLETTIYPHLERAWDTLAELNITTFKALCNALGVSATWHRSSQLEARGQGSQRVLDLCLSLGADRYLTGPAARAYLDADSFARAGVTLEYLAFDHPVYAQVHGDFTPYLSVADLIANTGREALKTLAGSGRAEPAGG